MRYFISVVFLSSLCHFAMATSPQCAGIDVNNVQQVKTCIAGSAIPGLDNMGNSMAGCIQLQSAVSTLSGSSKNGAKPSCGVIAQVLTDLNGRAPLWAPCVKFAENGTNPAVCLKALLAKPTNPPADCAQIKGVLRSVRTQLTGDMQNAAQVPGCEEIARAMGEINQPMTGYECGKYLPNNQAHITQCLHAYFRGIGAQPKAINSNCDQLRAIYQHAVQSMFDSAGMLPENPPNYQTPQCPMLEQALASYAGPGNRATANSSMSEPTSVNRPAATNNTAINTHTPAQSASTQSDNRARRAGQQELENNPLQKGQDKLDQIQMDAQQVLQPAAEEPVPTPPEETDLKTEAKKELKNKLIKGLGL